MTTSQSSGQEPTNDGQAAREGSDPDATGTATAVRRFGRQAHGGQRIAIVRAFRGYFTALAADDYTAACAYFTSAYRRALSAGLLPKRKSPANCRQLGAALRREPDLPIADAGETIDAEIVRIGIRGDQAVVLYRPKGGALSFITMTRERGRWRIISLVGAELRP